MKLVASSRNGQLPMIAFRGWDQLEISEQATIQRETGEAVKSLADIGNSKLSAGEHLLAIEKILKPKRMFTDYLTSVFHMSRATAYRYIDLYKATRSAFPKPVLKVAMMRSDDRLNLRLVKSAPRPPKTNDAVVINRYLDKLQSGGGPRLVTERSPEDLKKAMFQSASLLLRKVSGRSKANVLSQVVGMLLTEIGVSNPMSFEPHAVPEGYRAVRGRPRRAVA